MMVEVVMYRKWMGGMRGMLHIPLLRFEIESEPRDVRVDDW